MIDCTKEVAVNPSANIDKQAASLTGWQSEMYSRLRDLINDADPDLEEDWKWDTAIWTNKGNVCALGVFKDHLKINFFKGASLSDPKGLFNSGLEAKQSRSIDLRESDAIDRQALQDLVRAAADHKPARKR